MKSLRWRLQLWHAVVLTVVLAIFGGIVSVLLWQTRLQQVDAELDRMLIVVGSQMRRLLPPPARPGPRGPFNESDRRERPSRPENDRPRPIDGPPMFRDGPRERFEPGAPGNLPADFVKLFEGDDESRPYFIIWSGDGEMRQKSDSAPDLPFPGLQRAENELPVRVVRTRERRREVTQVVFADINVLVGRSIGPDIAAQRRASLWLIGIGAGVLSGGLLGGWWLSARAVGPMVAMSKTAQAISARNLSERIKLSETDDELGQLAVVLNQTFDRLQASFEQQVRFTADASHELRTPLAVIHAHVELALSRSRSVEEYRETLTTCLRASTRMRNLIDSLLTLARCDVGEPVVTTQAVELESLVRDCVELLQPLADERQVVIECATESASVAGDRDRLAQVVMNLVSNAVRYNRDGGRITIGIKTESEQVVLTVTDTGIGIPAADLPHLFERFYRVDKARSRSDGGSGLGLAICQSIVDSHGGTIGVRSEPDVGTTVEVRLPCCAMATTNDVPRMDQLLCRPE